jgi:predicted transcriptional regulator
MAATTIARSRAAMPGKTSLSEAEMEVLRVLWDLEQATIRAIRERLDAQGRRWAHTTIATLLQRLTAKGYVASNAAEVAHVYRALVSREQLLERRLRDAADELCDGDAAPLVLALVHGNRFTAEELTRFRRLLDDARAAGEQGASRSPRKRGRGEST